MPTILPFIWRESSPPGSNFGFALTGKVLVEQHIDTDDFTVYVFTLYPSTGASLATHESGATDEGYDSCVVEIAEGDDEWTIEVDTDARDCDGRISRNRLARSPGGVSDNTHRTSPVDWGNTSVHDYAARAAGY